MAWDAFRAPVFSYDEALRLAHAVGAKLDEEILGRLAEKKSGDIRLWSSEHRAAVGGLGPPDGARGMIDALHHAAHTARTRSLEDARELLKRNELDRDPRLFSAFEALLEVLPVSASFSGIELKGEAAAAGNDFEALDQLRRFAFADRIAEPEQLALHLAPDKLGKSAGS